MKKRRRRYAKTRRIVSDIVDAFQQWMDDVEDGADPIEAMHGHICGPDCWHQQMSALADDLKKEDR